MMDPDPSADVQQQKVMAGEEPGGVAPDTNTAPERMMEEGGAGEGALKDDKTKNSTMAGEEDSIPSTIEVERPLDRDKARGGGSDDDTRGNNCNKSKWALIVMAVVIVLVIIIWPVAWTQTRDRSGSSGGGTEETKTAAAVGSGPYNTTLKLFDETIARGYGGDVELLKADLTQAAWFLLNQVVKRNLQAPGYYWGDQPVGVDVGSSDTAVPVNAGMEDGGMMRDDGGMGMNNGESVSGAVANEPASPPGSSSASDGQSQGSTTDSLSDYGTNNQEDDIEEGDIVVSDGNLGTYPYICARKPPMLWNDNLTHSMRPNVPIRTCSVCRVR